MFFTVNSNVCVVLFLHLPLFVLSLTIILINIMVAIPSVPTSAARWAFVCKLVITPIQYAMVRASMNLFYTQCKGTEQLLCIVRARG